MPKSFSFFSGAWRQRYRPIMFFAAGYLLVSMVLRIVLWFVFGREDQVPIHMLPKILGAGVFSDGVVFVYLAAIVSIYLLLAPDRWFRARWHRYIFNGAIFVILFAGLFLPIVEFFFFEEFDSRFNLVAVDYLLYPSEVFINIWESYPVAWIGAAVATVTLLIYGFLEKWWTPAWEIETRFSHRLMFFFVHLALLAVALQTSTMTFAFSGNRVADQLSINGVSTLVTAFRTHHIDYSAFYKSLPPDQAVHLVQQTLFKTSENENGAPSGISRSLPANPQGFGKMNVAVIVEESLSAEYVGVLGSTRDLTPNFDRLSRDGLLFTRAYATGTRTVRGLEAVTLSFPPIPTESVIKRPGSEGMASWGELMRQNGYHTSFLYGGYGYFDNMNHFFGENGFEIVDRSDIVNPRFANIWGVCDEDLFDHALNYFDRVNQEGKPFFSIIMTTSNHRPFTFPKGIDGVPEKGGGRKAGIRYADHAVGRFIDQAKDHSWMGNTLFVIVADHCARVYGRAEIPIKNYEIPLLFYAPQKLAAGIETDPVSQMDIAPTVLGLLGIAYEAPFFGQNVLQPGTGGPDHPVFLSHNHDVAMLKKDQMAVLGLNRSTALFSVDLSSGRQQRIADTGNLTDETAAIYQTAFEMFDKHQYVLHSILQ